MMANSKRENIYDVVGRNIKKYRIKKGITQHELAESLLLSDNFIAKLESTTRQTISLDTLDDIALKLDTDTKEFLDRQK